MKIEWNAVTWYSKLLALAIFIAFPILAFLLGETYQSALDSANNSSIKVPATTYTTTTAKSTTITTSTSASTSTLATNKQVAAGEQFQCDFRDRRGCARRDFNLIYPNGGETLCIGDTFNIKWRVPKDVKTVILTLREGGGYQDIVNLVLGVFPSSYNETGLKNGSGVYPWVVPWLPDGDAYEMWINATYSAHDSYDTYSYYVNDVSDEMFSIRSCKG